MPVVVMAGMRASCPDAIDVVPHGGLCFISPTEKVCRVV